MKHSQKPRICIAFPGINYIPHTPYALNTLPFLPYLQQEFDITLVFRTTLEVPDFDYKYITILESGQSLVQDNATRNAYFSPSSMFRVWQYMKELDKFARKYAGEFDLIIEKQWSLAGALSSAFRRYGVPGMFFYEAEFYSPTKKSPQPFWQGNPIAKTSMLAFEQLLPHLRRNWLQKANSLIVETPQMQSFLIEKGHATPETRMYPIPIGIDVEIFYPRDRDLCREQLGISKDAFILTYVGSLNRFIQDPAPIIEALGHEKPKNVVLHIVGDGAKRQELEEIATTFQSPVVFHGRLPQERASLYIGAANLCIAPYNKSLYPDEQFTSASAKIPEYLACDRSILTIPCERMKHLLDGGRYGFMIENKVEAYREFLRNLPSKAELAQMEQALLIDRKNNRLKDKEIILEWHDVAEMYKRVVKDSLSRNIKGSKSLDRVL